MTGNNQLIEKFYTAFANHDAGTMVSYYHPDLRFEDPVFGKLNFEKAALMWQMLIERSKGNLKIEFSDVESNSNSGSATWIATYLFSKTNRKVINTIHADFEFKDGLIVKHTDTFNMWNWSRQALGFKGLLLGWTPFMQQKIKQQAQLGLKQYATK